MRLQNLLRVAPSEIHGRGVFLRRDIDAGTFLGTYGGRTVRHDGKYVLWVEEAHRIVGRAGLAPLKYLNHADAPNTYFDGFDLYALRAVKAGEELTFDYGEEWRSS
ncbi:MAG: SET domain-containing protein [Acidobacteria bacterium]|nr:SET domain-containing protein [Acidobacteriota bacterium]MCZ6727729.1 SET domain-containing protein [Acidobacteriota bacterium]